jgi:hypothetical protein
MRITIGPKSMLERRIEGATWGALLIWLGVTLVTEFRKGVDPLVAGGILLLSAFVQRAIGGEAGIVYWGSGLGLALWGLNDLVSGKHNFPALATVLIVVGVLVLLRAIGTPHERHLRIVRHTDIDPEGRRNRNVEP